MGGPPGGQANLGGCKLDEAREKGADSSVRRWRPAAATEERPLLPERKQPRRVAYVSPLAGGTLARKLVASQFACASQHGLLSQGKRVAFIAREIDARIALPGRARLRTVS